MQNLLLILNALLLIEQLSSGIFDLYYKWKKRRLTSKSDLNINNQNIRIETSLLVLIINFVEENELEK